MSAPAELTLDDLVVASHQPLEDALQQMTTNRRGIVFVCGDDYRLMGALSDGDVRRALLKAEMIRTPVGEIMNTDPVVVRSFEEARSIPGAILMIAIPILDADGRLVGAAIAKDGNLVLLEADAAAPASAAPRAELVVAVIPARGGSKRIPQKNLARVGGRSLLEWAILAARASEQIDQIIVSTDSPEIAEEARRLNVEVPWLRPDELSQDGSTSRDVMRHAMQSLIETGQQPTVAVLIEPTAPLRKPADIDKAIELLRASTADSAMTVCKLPHVFHPEEVLTIDAGQISPYLPERTMGTRRLRGAQRSAFIPSGVAYAIRVSWLLEGDSLLGNHVLAVQTEWSEYLDIDEPEDLQIADLRVREHKLEQRLAAPGTQRS